MSRGISLNKVLASECCAPTCGAPAAEDAPFPVCMKHMRQVFDYFDGFAELAKQIVVDRYPIGSEQVDALRSMAAARREPCTDHEQVYYVRTGRFVKIGFTANLKARLSTMRLDADAVMATEPGGRELERARHLQFAHLRPGKRENFEPADDLLSHIDMIRQHFGEPRITTWNGRVACRQES